MGLNTAISDAQREIASASVGVCQVLSPSESLADSSGMPLDAVQASTKGAAASTPDKVCARSPGQVVLSATSPDVCMAVHSSTVAHKARIGSH
eukprot:5333541-Prymnesium_polylepis.1